jgi:hypothetical protein
VAGAPVAALITGDTHVAFIDPKVEQATYGKGGMVDVLRPQRLVFHDLLDAHSCNPHHLGNPFAKVAKWASGAAGVRSEVMKAVDFVARVTPKTANSYVINSNHDDMLRRWVLQADWKADPENAEFYLETALMMVQESHVGPHGVAYPNPFAEWFRRYISNTGKADRFTVLEADASLPVAGVELGMHGDRGPNGARGSIKNLSRIGVKSVIGHSHSPGINEGCYQVGTSTRLRLEYNHGASSWLNTHCVLYQSGKRQLVNIIDGKWRSP